MDAKHAPVANLQRVIGEVVLRARLESTRAQQTEIVLTVRDVLAARREKTVALAQVHASFAPTANSSYQRTTSLQIPVRTAPHVALALSA